MQKGEENLTSGQEQAVLKLILAAMDMEKDPTLKAYGDICRALEQLRQESKPYDRIPKTRAELIAFWGDALGLWKRA